MFGSGGPHRTIRGAIGALCVIVALLAVVPAAEAYVYWGHFDNHVGLGRAGLDGSAAQSDFVPAAPGRFAYLRGVASDGDHVFFGSHFANDVPGVTVGRVDPAGTNASYAFTSGAGGGITGMAIGGGFLYFTSPSQDTSSVARTALVGGQGVQSIDSVFGDPNPITCGVVVDANYVYWANRETSSIGRAALATFGQAGGYVDGNWIQLGAGVRPCGIAVDDEFVYWGIYSTGPSVAPVNGTSLGRARKSDGSEATNTFVGGGDMVTGVAIDDQFLYWSNNANFSPGAGSIARANIDGSGVQQDFVSGLTSPWGVAVDAGGPAAAPPATSGPPLPQPVQPLPVFVPGDASSDPGSSIPSPPQPPPDPFHSTGTPNPISNAFSMSAEPRGHKARVTLALPGPGSVALTATARHAGHGVAFPKRAVAVTGAGQEVVFLKPGAAARAALHAAGSLRVTVKATFTPAGGIAATRSVRITMHWS